MADVPAKALTILDLIGFIGKFGANIPLVIAFIQDIIDAWQKLQDGLSSATGVAPKKLMAVTLTADETAACDAIVNSHASHMNLAPGAVGVLDGHRLIALLGLLKSLPQLLQALGPLLPLIEALFKIAPAA